MAKKQFEIQGSTLRIGGVDLTAGASSVVIPGVTQASTFIPEEVEKYGDDESTWADVPVIIDQYTYAVLLSQQTPPQGWSAPTYLAELDGDKIDEIEIISPGAGITELIATVMSDNIMAAPAGSSIDLETFDINVWVAINWSVKCEVGEIENVGGGGTIRVVGVPTTSTGAIGDVAGDVAFNGTHMYYCTANFPTTYNATLYGGYSGNAYPSLAKGEYPQPQPGWTFVWNLVTYTIVDVTDPNPGEWSLQVDQTIDTLSGGTITLITPGGSIWKRVAWGVDTW